jgi:hypothetical protein
MENKNPIDDLFKRELQEYEISPLDEMKKAIDSKRISDEPIGEDKKNRSLYVFILSILAGLALLWFLIPSNERKERNLKNHSENTIKLNKEESKSQAIENNKSKEVESSNKLNKRSKKEKENVEKQMNETKKTNALFSKFKLKNSNKANSFTANYLNKNSEKDSETNKSKSLEINEYKKSSELEYGNVQPDKSKQDSLFNVPQELFTSPNTSVKIDSISVVENEKNITIIPEGQNIALKDPLLEDKKQLKKKKIFLESGLTLAKLSQSAKNSSNAIQLNDSFSLRQPAFGLNILLGINYNNLLVKTGVLTNSFREQSNYGFIEQRKTTVLVDSIVIVGNDTTVIRNIPKDTMLNANLGNQAKTKYNYLQVPFILGYSYPLNKFCLEICGGVVGNVLVNSNGNYRDENKKNQIVYSDKNEAPLKIFYLTYQINAGIAYSLGEQTQFNLIVPFNFSTTSIYKNDYFMNRKINSVAVQLSYRYHF